MNSLQTSHLSSKLNIHTTPFMSVPSENLAFVLKSEVYVRLSGSVVSRKPVEYAFLFFKYVFTVFINYYYYYYYYYYYFVSLEREVRGGACLV